VQSVSHNVYEFVMDFFFLVCKHYHVISIE